MWKYKHSARQSDLYTVGDYIVDMNTRDGRQPDVYMDRTGSTRNVRKLKNIEKREMVPLQIHSKFED